MMNDYSLSTMGITVVQHWAKLIQEEIFSTEEGNEGCVGEYRVQNGS